LALIGGSLRQKRRDSIKEDCTYKRKVFFYPYITPNYACGEKMKRRIASILSALVVISALEFAIVPTGAEAASLQSITLLGGKTDASHPLGGYSHKAALAQNRRVEIYVK
jgi:hypothetical protein